MDYQTAELILRNTAVVADRLTPKQFSELGTPAVDAMLHAAASANEIAPLHEADLQILPTETKPEHKYRTEILAPLRNLQAAVNLRNFDGDSPSSTAAIQRAVWLGSEAFREVVTDPVAVNYAGVQRNMGYFSGNARAAASMAENANRRVQEVI